jgi:hypothetical protein
MYRMFYRGQFIGNAQNYGNGEWIACFIDGDVVQHCYRLKNKGDAKRWLTEMYLKHNSEAKQCA